MNATRRNVNIIIADDDSLTRSVLRLMLQEDHCTIVGEASDGGSAVELCQSLKPDVAFIDIDMPNLNGHQATEKIRLDSPTTKVIMISALATFDNVQKALQTGASGFVVKPFNAKKVIAALDNCLKNHQ